MKTHAAAILAIGLWGATIAIPLAGARQGDQVTKALDEAGVKSMLDGLGYEPKKLSNGYLIAIKKDEWTYNVEFILSADKNKLGLVANLGAVEKPNELPADSWRKLLESNMQIDPTAFYFDKDKSKLYLHLALDNRDLTPSYVRQQVEFFCANIKNTADVWKFAK